MKLTTKRIIMIGLFTALMAVGAFIKVPFVPVPFTMQTFFAVLAGMLLGQKDGTIAVILYVVIGLAGVPIFTNGGGFMYVLQPTFGYLLGMILCAFVCGTLYKKTKGVFWKTFLVGVLGMMCIYIVGVPYLYLMLNYYVGQTTTFLATLNFGFFAYVFGDTLTVVLGALVAPKVKKIYDKSNLPQNV